MGLQLYLAMIHLIFVFDISLASFQLPVSDYFTKPQTFDCKELKLETDHIRSFGLHFFY